MITFVWLQLAREGEFRVASFEKAVQFRREFSIFTPLPT
jgi:hypothetical protein